MNLMRSTVVTLAAMRLTRLVIKDELGERYVQRPLDGLVSRHTLYRSGMLGPVYPSWVWIRDGATCPACIGFWIGLGTLTIHGKSRLVDHLLLALALNEVVVHVGSALGDFTTEEDET